MTDHRPTDRDEEADASSDQADPTGSAPGAPSGPPRGDPEGPLRDAAGGEDEAEEGAPDEDEVVELDLGDEDGRPLSSAEERERLLAELTGTGEGEPEAEEPEVSSADERARILTEVVADAEARQVFQRVATREPGVTVRKVVVTAILLVTAAGLWVWQPPFLAPPDPPARTPEQVEAALRFAVTLQAERLLQRRTENRRLPDLLREAGDTLPGLTYQRPDGGSFILEGRSGDVTVRYNSRSNLERFLGDAPLVLAEGS